MMDENRKRLLSNDLTNGSGEVIFDTNTLDDGPSPRKRMRYPSSGSLEMNNDDINGVNGSNKGVSFILKSDSEDEVTDWNAPSMGAVATPVDDIESRAFFNQAESAKELALKAFRRVDSTASELNCLADPKLSENVVDMPEDSRDPFASLVNRAFQRTESVGSDLKRLVSTPSSDILSPDIFKGNLRNLKNHDNTAKDRLTEPPAPKQNSNDLDWLEECPDWLRDDYFEKEMAKLDSGLPRQGSKLPLVDKEDDNPTVSANDDQPVAPKLKIDIPPPCPTNLVQRDVQKSVKLPVESDKVTDKVSSDDDDLGVFEPDKDLNDAQSKISRPKRKKLRMRMRKRHCSRGKMGPPEYYQNMGHRVEGDDREDEDYSLKGRGKNWPPKLTTAGPEVTGFSDDTGSTQEFDTSSTQEYEMSGPSSQDEVTSLRDKNHNDMHLNTISSCNVEKKTFEVDPVISSESFLPGKVGDEFGGDESSGQDEISLVPREKSEETVEMVSDELETGGDPPQEVVGDTLEEEADGLNPQARMEEVARTPVLLDVENAEQPTQLMQENERWGRSHVVSDAIPYDEADADVTAGEETPTSASSSNRTGPSSESTNHVPSNYYSKYENSAAKNVSLVKCESLQRDAQNIANVFGSANVDAIYDKLNEHRDDKNRVEVVMNEILEGNFSVESAGNVGGQVDTEENIAEGTSTGEEDVDVLAETQIVLKRLEGREVKDIDPNEVFGLVERYAGSHKSRSERVNKVIAEIVALGARTNKQEEIEKKNAEDLFLRDVDQLVKKFPDVDQFQIYTLLEAHRGESDRVDVVLNELKNGGNVEKAGTASQPLVVEGDEDPLYRDMLEVARMFPHKDRNEIYAYLEGHHDKRNRVQIVTEEFLRMSQSEEEDVLIQGETVPESAPGPTSQATSNTERKLDIPLEEQVQNLLAVLPDCDPNFLYEKVEPIKNDPESVKNLAAALFERRNYPKKKDVLEEQRKHESRLKAIGMLSAFRLNEFLTLFPDPGAVFYSEEKPVSESYQKHVFVYLMNTFPYLQEKLIKATMEKHKNHLTTTLKDLEEVVNDNNIQTKKTRAKYPDKFRPIKRAVSKQMKFPAEPDEYFYKELAFTRNEEKIKEHLETQKKILENKRERAKKNGELYECQCCFDDEILFEDMKACIDGHLFCAECVRRSTEENIGNSKLTFPCLNGDCTESFTMKTLQEVLPSNVFSGLLNRIQEEEVKQAGIENLVGCPFCSFATIMEDENDKVLRCQNPDCLKESCRLCQEPNHIPLKCEEVEKQGQTNMRTYIENKISEAMIRTCWKCKKRFYKIEGCNKMTCSCGATMCYVCRAPNIGYDHFGNGRGGTCPPQTDIYELHRKEMEKAGLLAKKEYEGEHPEAAAGMKFDPLEHVKDATAAKRPAHLMGGGYDDYEDEEEDMEEGEEDSDDYEEEEYYERRRGYYDFEEEEEEDEDYPW